MSDLTDLKPEDMSDVILGEDALLEEGDIPMSQFEPDDSEEMTDEGLEEGSGEGADVDDIGERAGINYDPLRPLGEGALDAVNIDDETGNDNDEL